MEPEIQKMLRNLVIQLYEQDDKDVNFKTWCEYYGYDYVGLFTKREENE